MQPGEAELLCHRCGAMLKPGAGDFYLVRIEAFADPSPPELPDGETADDFAAQWEQLLDQMRDMSEQELLDQVYRRLTIHLCAGCYRRWIEDPVAKEN